MGPGKEREEKREGRNSESGRTQTRRVSGVGHSFGS